MTMAMQCTMVHRCYTNIRQKTWHSRGCRPEVTKGNPLKYVHSVGDASISHPRKTASEGIRLKGPVLDKLGS